MTPALQREIADISLALARLNASWDRLTTKVYEEWKAEDEQRPARDAEHTALESRNISVTIP